MRRVSRPSVTWKRACISGRYSVYLLYWYKSTNTDAAPRQSGEWVEEALEEDVSVCLEELKLQVFFSLMSFFF